MSTQVSGLSNLVAAGFRKVVRADATLAVDNERREKLQISLIRLDDASERQSVPTPTSVGKRTIARCSLRPGPKACIEVL